MREFISKLTWVDYIALVALLRGIYVGYKSGFFHELLRVAAYVMTLAVTFVFYETAAQILTLHTFLNATTARAVGFGLLLLATFLVTMVVKLVLVKLLKVGDGGALNRVLGMAVGGVRLLALLSFLFMAVDASPLKQLQEDVHKRSLTGDAISQAAPVAIEFLSQFASGLIGPKP